MYSSTITVQTFHLFFRVACEPFSQTCRNNGNPLKLKLSPLPTLSSSVFNPPYWFIQLQSCFDNRNVDTFVSKMHFQKISEICDFGSKTRFFTQKCFFAEDVVLCIVSMKLKNVFEYALWLAQTSIFKICCQMF